MAPVVKAIEDNHDLLEQVVVVTGQHRQMLDQVLKIFEVVPDYDLEIMQANQTIASVVARCLQGLEPLILDEKPDLMLVQGDTSTAFAAGLAAFYYKIPLGHVEAGLRTFDKWRPFPEEMNRQLLTDLTDLHFPPTASARQNLLAENVMPEKIALTGNTVIDALFKVSQRPYDLAATGIKIDPKKKLLTVTAHRRELFGQPIKDVCAAIKRLAEQFSSEIYFVIPVHKNPQVREVIQTTLGNSANIQLIEPLDYEPFIHLMKASYLILTDSGGVQEEAPSLGKPVLVMREKTERPEAIEAGTVKLVGISEENIYQETVRLLTDEQAYRQMTQAVNPYGDGQAAERTVGFILHYFGLSDRKPEEFGAKIMSSR